MTNHEFPLPMSSALDFIYDRPEAQQKLMLRLHDFLTEGTDLEPRLRYGIPFYYRRRWVCYLNPLKPDGVELAFTRAKELPVAREVLEFGDRKQVAGLKFFPNEPLPWDLLREVLFEAIELDDRG